MSNKSFVSMEQHQCFVCGKLYETGAILMDKHLRDSMEQHTVTGTGMCPEHEKLKDEGYIALIEGEPQGDEMYRTGRIMHVRASVWPSIFNMPVPGRMVAYIDKEAFDKLATLVCEEAHEHETPH